MSDTLKALFIGDIVGDAGLSALKKDLPSLVDRLRPNLIVANGENAAEGFGLTKDKSTEIFQAGVDVITSGNHVWQKRDFWPELARNPRILRPANYPAPAVGQGLCVLEKDGFRWAIMNLQGREFLYPIDCPFQTADALLATLAPGALVFVDFHAESTEEKEALAFDLDGKIQGFVGTHTHVQTADERILPKGTAYITDLGMTGSENSIIGMKTDICVMRSKTQMPLKLEVSEERAIIHGVLIEVDPDTLKAVGITRV
jgi:2',3'-cyclic-nucleotide 2'-phosphodiesterase